MLKGIFASLTALTCIIASSPSFGDSLDLARHGKAWHSKESASPLDDAKQITSVLLDPRSKSVLSIGCMERQLVVLVVVREYLAGGSAEVIYRIDKMPASSPQDWHVLDGTTVSAGLDAGSFISNLKDGSGLFVRVKGKRSGFVDANFSLGNVSQVLAKVREYCPNG